MPISRSGLRPAQALILAVLAELKNSEIWVSKTRLLKLLYLIDLDRYRTKRETATGWSWIFHRFGPWAKEYDEELGLLTGTDDISARTIQSDVDTVLLGSNRGEIDLTWLEPSLQTSVSRVLSRWGAQSLGRILDYVYFDTKPMTSGERGQRLEFESVWGDSFDVYRPKKSAVDKEKLREFRRLAASILGRTGVSAGGELTPPKYDEQTLAGLEALHSED